MAAGLIDRIVGYVRPAILGAGLPLIEVPGVRTIADLWLFRLDSAEVLGDDIRVIAQARRR
jgi:diaminohydroxyphosphoribosylaminopyrimidine deaminase/5-amino-6-(5-phosphoribosylamino)uracil reductase